MRPPPTEDLAPWFLTLDDLDGVLNWSEFYGNDHPVELDIGCGRGLFLVNSATAHPETNYCGIEIDYREGRRTARRLKKRTMANARVLGGDARVALEKLVKPRSVAAVHVYFPDPWWKRKHRRRRELVLAPRARRWLAHDRGALKATAPPCPRGLDKFLARARGDGGRAEEDDALGLDGGGQLWG